MALSIAKVSRMLILLLLHLLLLLMHYILGIWTVLSFLVRIEILFS